MPDQMTPAEQAVIAVLTGDSECTWHHGCDVEDCYGPRAAAIVAAVRGPIAANAQAYVLRDVANWIGARALTGPITLDEIVAHMRHRADVVEPDPTTTDPEGTTR